MGLIICDNCGCIDNTTDAFYWTNTYKDLWDEKYIGKVLCSECAPTHYKNGKKSNFTGKWHGEFKKRKPTKKELETKDYFLNR